MSELFIVRCRYIANAGKPEGVGYLDAEGRCTNSRRQAKEFDNEADAWAHANMSGEQVPGDCWAETAESPVTGWGPAVPERLSEEEARRVRPGFYERLEQEKKAMTIHGTIMHTEDCPGRKDAASCTCGGAEYMYTGDEAIVLAPDTPIEEGIDSNTNQCAKDFESNGWVACCVRKAGHPPPHHIFDPHRAPGTRVS